MRLTGGPSIASAYVERIDATHASAKRIWRKTGSPQYLSQSDVARLEEGSRIVQEPQPCEYRDGTLTVVITLPKQSVAAITVDLSAGTASQVVAA
jgi:hypothetical protein